MTRQNKYLSFCPICFLLVRDQAKESQRGQATFLRSPSKSGGNSGPPAQSTQVPALLPTPKFPAIDEVTVVFLWLCQGLPGPGPGPGYAQGVQCAFLISSQRGKRNWMGTLVSLEHWGSKVEGTWKAVLGRTQAPWGPPSSTPYTKGIKCSGFMASSSLDWQLQRPLWSPGVLVCL